MECGHGRMTESGHRLLPYISGIAELTLVPYKLRNTQLRSHDGVTRYNFGPVHSIPHEPCRADRGPQVGAADAKWCRPSTTPAAKCDDAKYTRS